MSDVSIIEGLRDEGRRALGGAAERDIGLSPEWISYIVDHVVVAACVGLMVRVTGDKVLPRPAVDGGASADAPPAQAVEELKASVRAIEEALHRAGPRANTEFDASAARRDIAETLGQVRIKGHPLDPTEIEDLATEISERFARRMAAEGGR
jgi:hypothetical protein